jgi:ADP-ribosyl-[dinitrogen reductase] hydrolase
MSQIAESLKDAALGGVIGACVGDAAGATLEFIHRQPTLTEVVTAMAMPGGGKLRVVPGQITDDSKLGLCLARSLAQSQEFKIEVIAQSYADWIRSNPFDIGRTSRCSLGCFRDPSWGDLVEQ